MRISSWTPLARSSPGSASLGQSLTVEVLGETLEEIALPMRPMGWPALSLQSMMMGRSSHLGEMRSARIACLSCPSPESLEEFLLAGIGPQPHLLNSLI